MPIIPKDEIQFDETEAPASPSGGRIFKPGQIRFDDEPGQERSASVAGAPARRGLPTPENSVLPGEGPFASLLSAASSASEPGWGETVKAIPELTYQSMKESVGGLTQMVGENAEKHPILGVSKMIKEELFPGPVSTEPTTLDKITAYGKSMGEEARKRSEDIRPPDQTFWQEATTQAGVSLGSMIPGAAAAIATKNPAFLTGAFGVQEAGSSYSEARSKGMSADRALPYALLNGVIEAGTEYLPAKVIFKAGTGPFKRLLNLYAAELPGENIATLGQSLNAYISGLDPNLTAVEMIERLKMTTASTIISTGVQGGISAVGNKIAERRGLPLEEKNQPALTEKQSVTPPFSPTHILPDGTVAQKVEEGVVVDRQGNLYSEEDATPTPAQRRPPDTSFRARELSGIPGEAPIGRGLPVGPVEAPNDVDLLAPADQQMPPPGRGLSLAPPETMAPQVEADLTTGKEIAQPEAVRQTPVETTNVVPNAQTGPVSPEIERPRPLQTIPSIRQEVEAIDEEKEDIPQPIKDEKSPFGLKGTDKNSSLVDFVRASGGINEKQMAGDVRQRFSIKEGFNLVNRKTGKTLDQLREAAAQHGFVPEDSTPADFLESLRRDVDSISGEGKGSVFSRYYSPDLPGFDSPEAKALERRTDVKKRKLVARMTREEMKKELLTSAKAGIPNDRAYEEAERRPIQAMLDMDGLKWINDNLGHEAGDAFIRAIGDAIQTSEIEGYHLSGDEFAGQFDREVDAFAKMETLRDVLRNGIVTVEYADGSTRQFKGLEFSYGVGSERTTADTALYADKARRRESGERAKTSTEPPPSLVEVTPPESGADNRGAPGPQDRGGPETETEDFRLTSPEAPPEEQPKAPTAQQGEMFSGSETMQTGTRPIIAEEAKDFFKPLEPEAEQPSLLDQKPEKSPWQMTRDEMVQSRIAKHEAKIKLINDQAKRIPGNLTRRRDNTDLKIASESILPMEQIKILQDKIAQLKSPKAQTAITKIHKEEIQKAISEGKDVPVEVLNDYPDLQISQKLEEAREQVDTEPSEAQIEANNYAHGHIRINGLDISIENPKGSTRKVGDKSFFMNHDYGYIKGTTGADKEHIDVYLGPDLESEKVFVVNQVDPEKNKFDEQKVMLGFSSPEEAKTAYLKQYDNPAFFGSMVEVSMDDFKARIDGGGKLVAPAEVIKLRKRLFDEGEKKRQAENRERLKTAMKGDSPFVVTTPEKKEPSKKKPETLNKLRALAERMKENANETLGRDTKRNTQKRAREAAYTDEEARKEIALAETMENLANAIEGGEVKNLSGLSSKTQLEELNSIANLAKYAAIRSRNNGSLPEREVEKPMTEEDVRFAKYPTVWLSDYMKEDFAKDMDKYRGGKSLAARLRAARGGVIDFDLGESVLEMYKKHGETRLGWQIKNSLAAIKRMRSMGITNTDELHSALKEFVRYRGKKAKEDPIKVLERELIGNKIPGYFNTSESVVDRMIEESGIEKGMKVLEPSAGKGSIADRVKEAAGSVDTVEINSTLRKLLEAKGHTVVATDFMDFEGKDYDRIVMNPPFENSQDVDHVRRAYDKLKPGGRVVAIMSEGVFFRNDKKATEFREWLDDKGTSEKLPEGSFKTADRPTGVNARMVIIDKPGGIVQFSLADRRALGFFSQLRRVVANKMPNIAPGIMIRNIIEKGGVKAEEIEWSGIEEFLKGKPKVTKQEVLDFIDQNNVQVEEVTKGGAELTPDEKNRLRKLVDMDLAGKLDTGELQAEYVALRERQVGRGTKFASYQIPGGENYRELLLTLPHQTADLDSLAQQLYGKKYDELSVGKRLTVEEKKRKADPIPFRSSHFDEPNVLAHVRFNDRIDADGKKVLFIEEIQSDWHQKGRKKGYGKFTVRLNHEEGQYQVTDTDGNIVFASGNEREAKEFAGQRLNAVPDAPFKKSWQELALKRMLRYAAEHGYDRLAWTTGEQQSARYDLSKHLDAVAWMPESGNDKGILVGYKNEKHIIKKTITKDELPDHIGKEAAEKLLNAPENPITKTRRLSGLDLKVGSEGMKGFYDQILPAFLNKYAKKWGARVGETTINTGRLRTLGDDTAKVRWPGGEKLAVHSIDITDTMKKSVLGEGQPLFSKARGAVRLTNDQYRKIVTDIQRIVAPGSQVVLKGQITANAEGNEKALASWGMGDMTGTIQLAGLHRTVRLNNGQVASLIQLSLRDMNEGTPYHEAWHSVENLLLSDKEIETLRAAFPDKDGVASTERTADAFADWVAKKRIEAPGRVRLILQKIKNFLEKLKNALRGRGFNSVEDLFEKAFSGELRERGTKGLKNRVGESMLSPMTPERGPGQEPTESKPPQPEGGKTFKIEGYNEPEVFVSDDGQSFFPIKKYSSIESQVDAAVEGGYGTKESIDLAVSKHVRWQSHRDENDKATAAEFKEALKKYEAKRSEVLNLIKSPNAKSIFVRYGNLPSSGQSFNYRDNRIESGISVYPAYKVGLRIIVDMRDMDAISGLFITENRSAFFVEGDEVGKGSDGEPLLKVKSRRRIPSNYKIEVLAGSKEKDDQLNPDLRSPSSGDQFSIPPRYKTAQEAKKASEEKRNLKIKLRAAEKASKEGFRAGASEERLKSEAKIAEMKRDRTAIVNRLKNTFSEKLEEINRAQELKDLKADILSRNVESIKQEITDYAKKHLPMEARGAMLSNVAKAKTHADLVRAFARVDKIAEQVERKAVISEFKDVLQRISESNTIAVAYRNRIRDLLSNLEFSEGRYRRAKALMIDGGIDPETEAMMEAMSTLARKHLSELSTDEIRGMLHQIVMLEELGKQAEITRKELWEARKEAIKEAVVSGTVPIEKPEGKAIAAAQHVDLAVTPMDAVIDRLDGGKGSYDGANMTYFKKPIDSAWGKFLDAIDPIKKTAWEKAQKLQLTNDDFERIGIYAADQQEGGREKLLNNGLTDAEIDAIQLRPSEMEFYQWMRKELDLLWPRIAKIMADVYGRPFGKVKNYFSFMTDWEKLTEMEVVSRLIEAPEYAPRTKHPEMSFTKSRVGPGGQKIKLNAMEIFLRHTENAEYLINMGPTVKMLYEVANSKEYGIAAGEKGQSIVVQWLDLIARKGGIQGDRQIAILDILRRNVGVATMAFKLSSALVQPSSIVTGASLIGRYAFTGSMDVATSKRWREFLTKNFPEIRDREADDPAFMELSDRKWLARMTKIGLGPLKKLDLYAASSITAGAYRKYINEHGQTLDFEKPNKDAIAYAELMLRRTQASMFFKDTPLAISRGALTGNRSLDKVLFQFQNFALNNWSLIRHDLWRAGIREKNPGKAVRIFTWLTLATLAEVGLRDLAGFLTGQDDDDPVEKEMVQEALNKVPFLSHLVSAIVYQDVPIPVVSTLMRIPKGIGRMLFGKEPETKARGLVTAVEGTGRVAGIPGAAQVGQSTREALSD